MSLFCQCEMCRGIAKNPKYPLCKHCNKHHDGGLICTEMKHLLQPKNKTALCPHCNRRHDERLHCLESMKPKIRKPDITTVKKITPKDCAYHIELENGKYTVYIKNKNGANWFNEFKALRYGKPWRDLCGDNLIYFLMVGLIEANEEIKKLKDELSKKKYIKKEY